MRFYIFRNREIADRADPRDSQIRDLQATLVVARKEAAQRKATGEEATSHLRFAHDRIKELLLRSSDVTEKLDACKEMLRTKITEREEMADSLAASNKETDRVREQLREVELELSMAGESGNMLDSSVRSSGETTMQTAVRVSDAERRQYNDQLTEAGNKLAAAEKEAVDLKARLQEAEATAGANTGTSAGGPAPAQAPDAKMSEAQRKEFEEKLAAAEAQLASAEKDAESRIAAATKDAEERATTARKDSEIRAAAALKNSADKLSALQARLDDAETKLPASKQDATAEKDAADKLVKLQGSLDAAEAKLAATKDAEEQAATARKDSEIRAAAARKDSADKLSALQARLDDAETKLPASKQDATAEKDAADKLAKLQGSLYAADAKLAAAQKDAEARAAAARKDAEDIATAARKESADNIAAHRKKLDAAEARLATAAQDAKAHFAEAMKESAKKLSDAQFKLSNLVAKLSKSEARHSTVEMEAETRIAAEKAKTVASQKTADKRASAATNTVQAKLDSAGAEIADLKKRLQRAELELNASAETNELTQPVLPNMRQMQNETQDSDKTNGLFKPTVEDGSPSLVECLTEELDRWKRHCHVLGDELKQQRDPTVQMPVPVPVPAPAPAPETAVAPIISQRPEQGQGIFARMPEPQRKPKPAPAPKLPPMSTPESEAAPEPKKKPAAGNGANGTDELTDIKGIGAVIAGKLNDCGIYRYEQLAAMSSEDLDRVLEVVPDFENRMKRYDYMQQALTLYASKYNDQL